jgi:hypothetical protein
MVTAALQVRVELRLDNPEPQAQQIAAAVRVVAVNFFPAVTADRVS